MFAVLALLTSLAFNVAVLSFASVNAAASAALSAVGVSTLAAREVSARQARSQAAQAVSRKTSQRVTRRMQRGAARSIASVGGEAIPVLGVGVIALALAMEVQDACDTAADMAGLEAAMATEGDMEAVRKKTVDSFDCKTVLPSYDDLPSKADILATIKSSPKAAWEASASQYAELTTTDWAAEYRAAKSGFSDWIGGILSYEEWRSWRDGGEIAEP